MSRTLPLVDGLLARGRRLQELGQLVAAATLFQKLAAFRSLPEKIAEELQSRLADIQFRQGRFTHARRHLRAALAHEPTNADYHHRFAIAVEEDPDGNAAGSVRHYARCVKLDPKNPLYHCDYAYAALNAGQTEKGLKALRRAERLAPDDAEVLSLVVRGLVSEGEEEEARRLVRAAMFRNPRDYRFRGLWQNLQFDALFVRQQERFETRETKEKAPAILRFPKTARKATVGARTIRQDGPATLKGPHARARKTTRP
ncbi:MAG: tetratricopeptide repeat protein [Gemmataceae bacterium]